MWLSKFGVILIRMVSRSSRRTKTKMNRYFFLRFSCTLNYELLTSMVETHKQNSCPLGEVHDEVVRSA